MIQKKVSDGCERRDGKPAYAVGKERPHEISYPFTPFVPGSVLVLYIYLILLYNKGNRGTDKLNN